MPEVNAPLMLYVEPDLSPEEQALWRDTIAAELRAAQLIRPGEESEWLTLLTTAAAEELPEAASGKALLLSEQLAPTFVWITVAAPGGEPTRLGDAVLATQLPGDPAAPPATPEGDQDPVFQRSRLGQEVLSDGSELVVQTTVTTTTVTLPELGLVDVCLWFNTIDLTGADAVLPLVAEIAQSPDLLTYLSN